MSFQRSLTGENAIYANVILNTNICANSVSTINLSATNASFINITTNSWVTGNVSTPNVIATNAYFSTLSVSTLNNISSIITSNLSTSNLSANYISVLTRISAPIIEGVQVIKNTNSSMYLYSSGGFLIRGWNQSDPASLGLYYASTAVEDMFGMNFEVAKTQGTTRGYSRITVGQNLSFQVIADTVPQLENTSTTGWKFYSSINSSGRANISNIYSSSVYSSTINASTVNASNMSLANFSANEVHAPFLSDVSEIQGAGSIKTFATQSVFRNLGNDSAELLMNYDDATFTEVNGYKLTVGYVSGITVSINNLSYNFTNNGVSQLQNTSAGWTFFKPINVCANIYSSYNIYTSYMSVRNMNCQKDFIYASAYGDFNNTDYASSFYFSSYVATVSALTGVSAVYTCIYCSNLSVSNMSITGAINVSNLSIGNRLEVANSIDTSNIYASTMYASNIDVLNRIDAKKVVLTINLDTPIANVSDLRVSNISGINVSVSAISTSTITASSIIADNLTFPSANVSNISVSYVSGYWQTNSCIKATDTWFTNISATGIVTVSYFSAKLANVSNLSVSNTILNNASITTLDSYYRLNLKGGSAIPLVGEIYSEDTGMYYNIVNPLVTQQKFQYNNSDLFIIGNTSITAKYPFYVSTANICNISVTNLSTTLISNSSRISASSISVSNMSVATKLTVTNISFTNGGELTGTFNTVATGTLDYTSIYASYIAINGPYGVSFRSTCTVSSYVSYVSVSNLSGGTLQATTANFSTLNVSTFALTSVSLTNLSVSTSATIKTVSVSNLYTSYLGFLTGTSALQFGAIQQAGNDLTIQSNTIAGNIAVVRIGNNGNMRFDVGQSGVSCYVSFHCSRGNFSTLTVNTFNPANITTTTMTASTVNASSFNVSTFNPTIVNACNSNICNISTSYLSSYSNDMTLLRAGAITTGGVTIKNDYDTPSFAFATSNNFLMGRLGYDIYTSEFNINTYTTGGIYRTTLDTPDVYVSTSTLNVCDYNGSLVAQINTNTSRFSISNISTSYVSTSDITSTDGNISYLYGETFYPNYIIAGGGDFSGNVNFSNISIQKINNSFSTITTSQPLTLYSVSNTSTTGLRVPTYIDSQDLGAITMGFNQTTGFINCCRSTRIYGNILVDGNVNALVDTADLGLGRNLASGNIVIGNTTMNGNISIDTTGDIVFGCDRRSTWNTSNIVPFSTQLGSGYSVVGNINSGNVSGTNTCRIYYPTPTNISLLNLPVGLYLCSMVGSIKGFSGYNAISANAYAGICYGTNASFTDANTTRINTNYIFGPNLYSNASTATVIPMNFTFPFNVSTTGQKVGFFIQYQAANLATAGGMVINFFSCNVTKIA